MTWADRLGKWVVAATAAVSVDATHAAEIGHESNVPTYYFDADETALDLQEKSQLFRGNVVAITDQAILSADQVRWSEKHGILQASNHVIALNESAMYTGESLHYDARSQVMTLEGGQMLSPEHAAYARHRAAILGPEFDLELGGAARNQVLELEKEKTLLAQTLLGDATLDESRRQALLYRYAHLIRSQAAIWAQGSEQGPPEASLSRFAARRQAWAKLSSQRGGSRASWSLAGRQFKGHAGNAFEARQCEVTWCICHNEQTPAWSFYADTASGQAGGYLDLKHSVLRVGPFPLMYFPYLKLPLKNTRQSGFLFPDFSYSSASGSGVRQRLFVDLGSDQDLTPQIYLLEKRGVQVGSEWRHRWGENRGFKLDIALLRDSKRAEEGSQRRWLVDQLAADLDQARAAVAANPETASDGVRGPDADSARDPVWWTRQGLRSCLSDPDSISCRRYELEPLHPPAHPWRGHVSWASRSRPTPRIWVHTQGQVVSDHTYDDEVQRTQLDLLSLEHIPAPYAESHVSLGLGSENHLAAVRSQIADPIFEDRSYAGLQTPLDLSYQSRFFYLLPDHFVLRPAVQLGARTKVLQSWKSLAPSQAPTNRNLSRLDIRKGSWHHLVAQAEMNVLPRSFFQTSFFLQQHLHHIHVAHYDEVRRSDADDGLLSRARSEPSTIDYTRFGIQLALPLEGESRYDPPSPGASTQGVRHEMNWDLQLNVRPGFHQRGNYGAWSAISERDPETGGWQALNRVARLTFFEDDLKTDQERVLRIATQHRWSWFLSQWQLHRSPPKDGSAPHPDVPSLAEALDQAIRDVDHLRRRHTAVSDPNWVETVSNFPFFAKETTSLPASLSYRGEISYDFALAQQRHDRLALAPAERSGPLPQPWSSLRSVARFDYQDWSLALDHDYHVYAQRSEKTTLHLQSAQLGGTMRPGLSYTLDQNIKLGPDYTFKSSNVRELGLELQLSLGTAWRAVARLGRMTFEDQPDVDKRSASLAANYDSNQRCWGLRFAWSQNYAELKDWSGTYYLGVQLKMMETRREFGNLLEKSNQKHGT